MEKIIEFIREVYEYFRNDYSIIIDFLSMDSPWDKHFLSKFDMSKEELDVRKIEMEKSITQTYKKNIINTALEMKKIRVVDKKVFEQFTSGESLEYIFFSDSDSNVIMQKLFFRLMKYNYGFKESTYHKFKRNVWDINEIYNDLYDRFGIEQILDHYQDNPLINDLLLKTEDAFDINLYVQTIHYFNNNFRDMTEEKEFLDYLFSLCYAYMLYEQASGRIDQFSGVEEAIKSVVECGLDTHDCFYYNQEIGVTILSLVNAMTANLGDKYDLRKAVNDSQVQDYFRIFDKNYDTKFDPDVMIYDFSIDSRLEAILEEMRPMGLDNIFTILKGSDTIYSYLFDNGLDPRYEDFFKNQLIRKVCGDAYEAETFYRKHESRAVFPHVEDLKKLGNSDEAIFSNFFECGDELLSIYYYYHNEHEYIREKARLEAYTGKELPVIMKLNPYAHYNYIHIVNGDLIELDSVNKINEVIDLDIEGMYKALLMNPSYISLVVMNVYENMLQEPINDGLIKELIETIEQTENITDYMIQNKQKLLSIIKLFKAYNGDELCNMDELGLRSSIKEEGKKKVLRRLNPFEEEDKKQ